MKLKNIELPMGKIVEFCDRWQVTKFDLFSPVLHCDRAQQKR